MSLFEELFFDEQEATGKNYWPGGQSYWNKLLALARRPELGRGPEPELAEGTELAQRPELAPRPKLDYTLSFT